MEAAAYNQFMLFSCLQKNLDILFRQKENVRQTQADKNNTKNNALEERSIIMLKSNFRAHSSYTLLLSGLNSRA